MGTYIYGIARTKQHKTYGTIGVMTYLFKPVPYSWTKERLAEERKERRVLNKWVDHESLAISCYEHIFPRVIQMDKGTALYYYTGQRPIWSDDNERYIVPLDDYIAQGGVVEVYDKTTKQLTPLPRLDTPQAKVSV
jgi:hypothetical protein